MPEFLHPGVFILETSFRGKPVEGVATSTAGFVGRAQTGPVGKPTLVTSFTQFVRDFGAPYSSPENLGEHLGHAARGFFDNGGLRAWIVRVLGAGSAPAKKGFYRGNVLRLPPTTTVRGPTNLVPVTSLRNVKTSTTPNLEIYVRASASLPFPTTPKYTLTVQSYDAPSKVITLAGAGVPTGAVLDPANTYLALVGAKPSSLLAPAPPLFTALNAGASGNTLGVAFRAADLPPVRLATKKLIRARPVIGDAAVAADVISGLDDEEIRQLRNDDSIQLENAEGVIETKKIHSTSGIGPAAVKYAAMTAVTVGATGSLFLIKRGTATFSGDGAKLFGFTASIAFGASQVSLPHAVAAMLRIDDQLVAKDAANTATFTVTDIDFALTAKLDSAVTGDHGATTITLLAPAAPDQTGKFYGRLVVADAAALQAPLRQASGVATPESIAVGAGGVPELATVVLVDPATNTVFYDNSDTFAWSSPTFADSWTSLELLQVYRGGDKTIEVASTTSFYAGASVKLDDGASPQYGVLESVDSGARTVTLKSAFSVPGNGFLDTAADPALRKVFLQVLELDALVYQNGTVVETFGGLGWNGDAKADSFKKYYAKRINDARTGSSFVKVSLPTDDDGDITRSPSTEDGFVLRLTDGSDGNPPTNIDLIGKDEGPGSRTGIQALAERDDIAIVAVPGVTDVDVQGALITHCELLRYRFAVLDGVPGTSDVSKLQAHRNNFDTKYAGQYTPWFQTLDLATGNTLLVPPSGHIVGVYARSDNERGVHKAPANEVVRSITDLEYQFGDGEQDVLNPVGVNLVREFTGRGKRVWGARTLSSDPEWKYVNVRRLFIFLEHSIDTGTQWVVFEPNNEELWARVKSTIEAFLFGVWKTGALMGTKPEEAFFVKVDRTTMTQDDIDNGRLVVLIGVAPTLPAEFVIFKIGQFTASAPAA